MTERLRATFSRARDGRIAPPASGIGSPSLRVVAIVLATLLFASCERTPTKADYIDARVQVECGGQGSEAFRACRIEVIKRYMNVPLEELQKQFPAPEVSGRTACG